MLLEVHEAELILFQSYTLCHLISLPSGSGYFKATAPTGWIIAVEGFLFEYSRVICRVQSLPLRLPYWAEKLTWDVRVSRLPFKL